MVHQHLPEAHASAIGSFPIDLARMDKAIVAAEVLAVQLLLATAALGDWTQPAPISSPSPAPVIVHDIPTPEIVDAEVLAVQLLLPQPRRKVSSAASADVPVDTPEKSTLESVSHIPSGPLFPVDLTLIMPHIAALEVAAMQLRMPVSENPATSDSVERVPVSKSSSEVDSPKVDLSGAKPSITQPVPTSTEGKNIRSGPIFPVDLALLPSDVAALEVDAMQLLMPFEVEADELATAVLPAAPAAEPTVVKLRTVKVKIVEAPKPTAPSPAPTKTVRTIKSIDAMRGANWPVYYEEPWPYPTGQYSGVDK
ncbi:hypothetical protein HDU84_000616 [Entophlyctis sp. JEL0112]|nr:hypothetical protein HDU84_000616 [Entophlyctis sp. JEL0112]